MPATITAVIHIGNKNIPKGKPILVKHKMDKPRKDTDWNLIVIDAKQDLPYGAMKRGPGVVFFEQILAWMEMPDI